MLARRPRTPYCPLAAGLLLALLLGPAAPLTAETPSPSVAPAAAAAASQPAIGDKLPRITFKDIRYLTRSLNELSHKLDPVPKRFFVLCFTNTTCPLVQKYLPRLKALDEKYRDEGVQFVAVNVGVGDTIRDMATQAVLYDVPFPFVKDTDGNCVKACGVQRTPEVVIIDTAHRLRYRGRIDNQYRLGGTLAEATERELEDALVDLLAAREPVVSETVVDGCQITLPKPTKPLPELTYADVAPLFAQHCANCHKPGTAAPFTLQSYDDIAAQAEMIAEVITDQRMPPWYASDGYGEFTNCSVLSADERRQLLGWLAAGHPCGEASGEAAADTAQAAPATSTAANPNDPFADIPWRIDEPDWVINIPVTYTLPADGYVDYKYAVLPTVIINDTWFEQVEIQPDNPRVLHHCNLGTVPIGQGARGARLITGQVPGGGPMVLHSGIAGKLPAGSALALQIHFTTTGKPETCRLRVGFRFARNKVQQQLRYLDIIDGSFAIPPFAPAHPVTTSRTVRDDVTIAGLFTHMHVRGKDITFRAYAPGREPEIMMIVPNYNFDWQMPYHLVPGKYRYPAGTRFECTAHFDNSTFNPYNPDPRATVREGQQTTSEMMYGFVFYTVDAERLNLSIDPTTGHVIKD